MNQPSSTITTAGLAGAITGLIFIFLAIASPEAYLRIQVYPGAEAHLTTVIMFLAGYWKREKVLPVGNIS